MVDHKVLLECGFPKIVYMIRQKTPSTTKVGSADLFTFSDITGDTRTMINRCGFLTAVVHPYKIYTQGYKMGLEHFNGQHHQHSHFHMSLLLKRRAGII